MTSSEYPAFSIQYPAARIDTHQHFWNYDPVRDGWITNEMKLLKQDFLPEHFAPILAENKIDGCIGVQADQSERETEFLLALANRYSLVKGVVGWVDLCSHKINERLDYFSRFKPIKGFRHILQTAPSGFMNQKDFHYGISQLEKYHFTYDILIYYHQLPDAIEFVKQFPHQKFVIDHLAKPSIKLKEFDDWSKGMEQIASFENVSCKISGFTTEANWKTWQSQDFLPYFDFALQYFGSKRLMYGSDWPVCLIASTYKSQLSLVEDFISKLSATEKQQIMGGNAIDFYNL
jgi:L-fuconolactonase